MPKSIYCFVLNHGLILCNKHSFFSLESVTGLPTDMVKKRCTGVNPSAALDFMKAGKCVSVSLASLCFEILYTYHNADLAPL